MNLHMLLQVTFLGKTLVADMTLEFDYHIETKNMHTNLVYIVGLFTLVVSQMFDQVVFGGSIGA